MRRRALVPALVIAAVAAGAGISAQGTLAPERLREPLGREWPMHNGDYSGRRFSHLTALDTNTVDRLTLAWVARPSPGAAPAGGGGPTSVTIKGTPVVVNGVMYVTIPDHVWALDARTGRQIWHATWPSKGGWHIGNRGVAVLGSTVYVETPDCHLVALNIRDGREKWRTEICDLERFYYASAAPLIVKDHVIVGVSGDDLDIPGYLQSHDPETGGCSGGGTPIPSPARLKRRPGRASRR